MSEELLVEGLRRGEALALEQLVRRHGPGMLAVMRRLLRHEAEARDALQEAFVSVLEAIGTFQDGAQLAAWLHRIAVNTTLQRLRRRARLAEDSIDAMLPAFLDDGHHARHPHEWTLLEPAATRDCVRAAIDRLPEPFRVVLLLRDIEGMETAEVAQALGLTDTLVKLRLHQARQALRALLEPRFERES